jgi:ABC-2 type transport system ATP-binding protein
MAARARGVGPLNVIDARAVGYTYAGRGGVRDISLAVEPGAIVGVLGPNGAGKTTLLRLLATALPPQTGTLQLFGAPARPDAALRRRIGYAAESVHIEPLSGRQNALCFARAAGMPAAAAERAVDDLLARFRLSAHAHEPVRGWSHGMRRKLLLAAALAPSPRLLLLDEPTLGLDPDALDALDTLVRLRARAGAAVVIATNELPLAERLCERVVFLSDGRLVLDGAPRALLAGVGRATFIRFVYQAAGTPAWHVEGARVVRADARETVLRAARGSAVLPALCASLVAQGVRIDAVEVREPDLRDVFHAATGRAWDDPAGHADAGVSAAAPDAGPPAA